MTLKDMNEQELELWIEAKARAELKSLASLRAEMESFREILLANSKENKELLEMFSNVKAFLDLMQTLERIAVFFTKIGVWIVMIWAIWMFLIKEAVRQFKDPG